MKVSETDKLVNSTFPTTGGAAPSWRRGGRGRRRRGVRERQPLEDLGRGEQRLAGCWCADEDAKRGCAAGHGCVRLGLGFLFFIFFNNAFAIQH